MCEPARACKYALAEATDRWPDRSKISDGICSSPIHRVQSPNSDHDEGNAFDLTHDPSHGVDCSALVGMLVGRRDPRVKYVIWNRTIWRSYPKPGLPAWTPEPYTGTNTHTRHCHVSIQTAARSSTAVWWEPERKSAEDDMPMTCVVPWVPRRPGTNRVAFFEVYPIEGTNDALVASFNDAPFDPPWDDGRPGDDPFFGFWARRLTGLTGRPTGIDVAPDGESIVVTCRGGGTYDVARRT